MTYIAHTKEDVPVLREKARETEYEKGSTSLYEHYCELKSIPIHPDYVSAFEDGKEYEDTDFEKALLHNKINEATYSIDTNKWYAIPKPKMPKGYWEMMSDAILRDTMDNGEIKVKEPTQEQALSETQLCLHRLINRVRQAVNKNELVLNEPFQKAFDNALYIIKKYYNPKEVFRIVHSDAPTQDQLWRDILKVVGAYAPVFEPELKTLSKKYIILPRHELTLMQQELAALNTQAMEYEELKKYVESLPNLPGIKNQSL